jgi:fatty-acyl-CoA synthase
MSTLPGLMMDVPLTTTHLLWRMRAVHPDARVSTVTDPSGACRTTTFGAVAERAERLAAALAELGVGAGTRVGSFAWNTQEHLETYYAVMGMGAVLHTINLRLHPDQIAYTVEHAGDEVILLDASLAERFLPVLARVGGVRHVVVIGPLPDGIEVPGALDYDALLASAGPFTWPAIDERSAASLCYTSGTTGHPKGVLYSHRSIVLHALAMAGTDAYGISRRDRVLSIVPMFHAMGWGLPFVCAVAGADLVMPGAHLQPGPVSRVVDSHGVTWSCGVPTVWMDVLHDADEVERAGGTPVTLATLRTVISGGTQVPESLMRAYQERFDVDLVQGWGMTEIFPGATLSMDQGDDDPERWSHRAAAGRVSPLYELRIAGEDGGALPADGATVGEIEVRGPAVAGAYFAPETDTADRFHDGWLRTGDVGTLDRHGWLRITDRSKDAIKSGGEWISSVDL